MYRILFICHGNICRSPMAEFIMKQVVEEHHTGHLFHIASAATSREEIGNPVYPPARRKLAQHGISCAGKTARQMTEEDYDNFDYIIAAEHYNLRNMTRFVGDDPQKKVHLMLDFTDHPGDIDDPWYTGDFETPYRQIRQACEGLYDHLMKE